MCRGLLRGVRGRKVGKGLIDPGLGRSELAAHLEEEKLKNKAIQDLVSYGCQTRMHIMLLQAPALKNETYLKDIDFTPDGIRARWHAGYCNASRVLDRAAWLDPCDPLEGVILHDFPEEPDEEA